MGEGELYPNHSDSGSGVGALESRPAAAEGAPLLHAKWRGLSGRRRAALIAYAREQRELFVQAWAMMLGWAAGDVAIAVMQEVDEDSASVAAIFALVATVICGAAVFAAQGLAASRTGSFSGMLLTLSANAAGVMLGRSWNETVRRTLPGGRLALLWQGIEALAATCVAAAATLLQTESRWGRPVADLLAKVLGMIVAWGWNDTAQKGLQELRDSSAAGSVFGKLQGEVIYAVGVTFFAAVVAYFIARMSRLAVAVWGLACGYGWQTVFQRILFKESWAPVKLPPDTLGDVGWLLAFASTITVLMALGTTSLRSRAEAVLSGRPAPPPPGPDGADGEAPAASPPGAGPCQRPWVANLLALFMLSGSLNVAWAWGDTWKGLFNLLVPGDWGGTTAGKSVYLAIVCVIASAVLWLHSRGAFEDRSFGDAGAD
eukprot:TRINITY_DN3358_c0_g1_i1.p1 TRINITY_DN3358_c0_g1~~TRINITY_DN3358_c0_g1_i1.p1  ORF type:complete len:430 (+),score=120.64 TRINITY_DN3358_c0_g1_i1:151-1440(+)